MMMQQYETLITEHGYSIQNTRILQLKQAFGFVLLTNVKHFLEFKPIQA